LNKKKLIKFKKNKIKKGILYTRGDGESSNVSIAIHDQARIQNCILIKHNLKKVSRSNYNPLSVVIYGKEK